MSYFTIVQDFFEEIFDEEYLIVSIPFIIIISGISSSITSYFYKKKIKELKSQNEILVIMNTQYNQAIQQRVEEPRASAPPISYLYTYV